MTFSQNYQNKKYIGISADNTFEKCDRHYGSIIKAMSDDKKCKKSKGWQCARSSNGHGSRFTKKESGICWPVYEQHYV